MKQSLDLVYYDVPWIKGTKVRCGGAAGGCPSNRKIGSSKHQIHYIYVHEISANLLLYTTSIYILPVRVYNISTILLFKNG